MSAERRHVDCGSHGRVPWDGDVVCSSCGAIYLAEQVIGDRIVYPTMDESGRCPCGARLMPDEDRSIPFAARIACRACARGAAKSRG